MRKVYVVGGSYGYANWMQGEIVDNMKDADLVVFTGGEDVHPDLYGHPMHPQTYTNLTRDRYEMKLFKEAVELKKHIIGICRGSQFLCVANGGLLIQHQQNPAYEHPIFTNDGKTLEITSTHHQAAYPYNLRAGDEYHILGWTIGLSKFHEDGNREEMKPDKECEIVYYPKNMCLGIQGHPEMMEYKHPTIAYLRNLLTNFLLNKIDTSDGKEEKYNNEIPTKDKDKASFSFWSENTLATTTSKVGSKVG